MSSSGYSVVPVQKALAVLRIIQCVLGVVVLGMAAYIVSLFAGYGTYYTFEPGALAIFTAIATLIYTVYWFVAHANKSLYNYWAILSLEIFVWVFWLTTFALYASFVASTLATYASYSYGSSSGGGGSTSQVCYQGYCVDVSYKRDLLKRYTTYDPKAAEACVYAGLAFSVVNFLLSTVTLIVFSINLARHRKTETTAAQIGGAHHQPVPMNKVEMAV